MLRMMSTMCVLVGMLAAQAFAGQSTTGTRGDARSAAKPAAMVNLNTATQAELETLPGVGAKMAARIIEYRQKKGPFKKIEELMNVQGIGEKNFLKLKPQLTVGAAGAKLDATGQQ
jgi:competence protein ComEA